MSKPLALGALLFAFFINGQIDTSMNSRRTALPAKYWPLERSQPIVEKTQSIQLTPDLSVLTPGERQALGKLLEVGNIFQGLYEEQRHLQAASSFRALSQLDKSSGSTTATQNLLTLYRLNQGPIATTLENQREAFLPVEQTVAGKNVYPWAVTKAELDSFLTAYPERRRQILDPRTLVRRATRENLGRDLAVLEKYPALATLHPALKKQIENVSKDLPQKENEHFFYAVPYAVAYADALMHAHLLLNQAADALEKDDEEFAGYLRNRSRDLLTNDYESGDAAWVTGHFKHLNAQIGAYETYDDELYGVKTFFACSLLAARPQETLALREAMKGLQTLEDSLPYQHHKKVREDIPVGVYDVIADFGQARGGNTATILPNESYLARRYGRTILLRANIMREPNIFAGATRTWEAAIAPEHQNDVSADGNFYRTLWHEVGHYLGVDRTKDNRDLDEALQDDSSVLEEMKADLVSLFVAASLHKQGYYNDGQLQAVYASGIQRVLQSNRPRRDQPYNTMQLMQWNFFLEQGLLSFASGKLRIHYDKYHEVVGMMLAKTLEVQAEGDKALADHFIEQYSNWDVRLHGLVAQNIRAQQQHRFRIFKYAELGE